MNSSCKIPLHFTERNMRTRENRGDRYVTRDGHGLVLEENQSEQNQTVFKIYNNRTKLLKWFGFIILNQTITNFSLKKPNRTVNHEPN
jgi:hypothetical protein